jgi:GNAT superfamily N-acetyltransferase
MIAQRPVSPAVSPPVSPPVSPCAWQRDDYTISTDPSRLDLDVIHGFLARSYWSPGIPRETIARGIAHSTCFGVHHVRDGQVGFARVVSDHATFGYLADVFILEAHRGRGLSKWLIECILAHPDLQGFRRWMLGTRDAHGLYARFGFSDLAAGSHWMEK